MLRIRVFCILTLFRCTLVVTLALLVSSYTYLQTRIMPTQLVPKPTRTHNLTPTVDQSTLVPSHSYLA